jgi:hypothetical protein
LHPPDELLVDDSQLRPSEELRYSLTDEHKDDLWNELLQVFTNNDKSGSITV